MVLLLYKTLDETGANIVGIRVNKQDDTDVVAHKDSEGAPGCASSMMLPNKACP